MSVDPPKGLEGLRQRVEFLRERMTLDKQLEAKKRASDAAYRRLTGRR